MRRPSRVDDEQILPRLLAALHCRFAEQHLHYFRRIDTSPGKIEDGRTLAVSAADPLQDG